MDAYNHTCIYICCLCRLLFCEPKTNNFVLKSILLGTSVFQITATDADDPTYGNSARIVYSILQGNPYFSVDPKTGKLSIDSSSFTGNVNITCKM